MRLEILHLMKLLLEYYQLPVSKSRKEHETDKDRGEDEVNTEPEGREKVV
jgi:hypothetical protein